MMSHRLQVVVKYHSLCTRSCIGADTQFLVGWAPRYKFVPDFPQKMHEITENFGGHGCMLWLPYLASATDG